jgi:uncharacterized membrane protein
LTWIKPPGAAVGMVRRGGDGRTLQHSEDFMIRSLAAIALLLAMTFAPAQPAAARDDVIGGALLGGALGAIFGGAITGKGGGVAIGAIIGATTGAIIADQGRRNARGYYAWRQGCYARRLDGLWVRVHPRYCT